MSHFKHIIGYIKGASKIYKRDGLIELWLEIYERAVDIMIVSFLYPIRKLLEIIPQNEKLVLFSTIDRMGFEDNSRYLFEYCLNVDGIEPIWVTKCKDEYGRLSKKGYPVKYIYSLSGLFILAKASYGFVMKVGLHDLAVHPAVVPRTITVIHLTHGEKIWMLCNDTNNSSRDIYHKRKPFKNKINHTITRSEITKENKYKKYAHNDDPRKIPDFIRESIQVTGKPKDDILIGSKDRTKLQIFEQSYQLTIMYTTTRHHNARTQVSPNEPATDFFPFDDFDVDKLHQYLEKNDILLIIRPHPKDITEMNKETEKQYITMKNKIDKISSNTENVKILTDVDDMNYILKEIDVLITDYSSIVVDYLLLDRPIIFIPYDYDEWVDDGYCIYDYFDNSPGPIIKSYSQFEKNIDCILNGQDKYAERRKKMKNLLHSYGDGNSRERIIEKFIK